MSIRILAVFIKILSITSTMMLATYPWKYCPRSSLSSASLTPPKRAASSLCSGDRIKATGCAFILYCLAIMPSGSINYRELNFKIICTNFAYFFWIRLHYCLCRQCQDPSGGTSHKICWRWEYQLCSKGNWAGKKRTLLPGSLYERQVKRDLPPRSVPVNGGSVSPVRMAFLLSPEQPLSNKRLAARERNTIIKVLLFIFLEIPMQLYTAKLLERLCNKNRESLNF